MRSLRTPSPRTAVTVRALASALALATALAGSLAADPARAASPDGLASLERAEPCCQDPSSFRYEKLGAGATLDFTIDRRNPVFEFQAGRSRFRAFELPRDGGAYVLELRSFLEGPADPRRARVFYPVIAVLTDDFIVSRSTDLDHLRFELPVFERAAAPAYRLVVPLDAANPRERYLVVYTPAALLAPRPLAVTTPESAERAAREAYLGASAHGRFRITLRAARAPAEPGADAEAAAR